MPDAAYEGGLFAGLVADFRDRIHKDYGRANARLGFLKPPGGSGRIIWIKADAASLANKLAVEIACALRERRQDVRLVVTFEKEYSTFLSKLEKLPRTGFGFGPADRAAAIERVLSRLAPAGVIALGQALRPEVAHAVGRARIPCCVVHGLPPEGSGNCRGFPNTLEEQVAWQGRAQSDAALFSLIVEAQVEPVFQGLAGAHARALWWIADLSPEGAGELASRFGRSTLARTDILFLGANCVGASRLSDWDRNRDPLAPGAIVWVDDERFWPALAVSCTAIHVVRPSEQLLWAALAGGRVVSARSVRDLNLLRPAPMPELSDAELWGYWEDLIAKPAMGRAVGDGLRRFFWSERRRAAAVTETLLQMVYDW
ncbi:MAG: glycosyltransferase N-terminal domain-containing protein [Acidiferrobacter sp.]